MPDSIPKSIKDLGINGEHTALGKTFLSDAQFKGFVAAELIKLNSMVSTNTADIKILNDFKGQIYGGTGMLIFIIGLGTKLAGLW